MAVQKVLYLKMLKSNKNISGLGIEIDHKKVKICLRKGLSVVEGDANFEITNFPDHSFDYVILSQTLQTVFKTKIDLGRNFENKQTCHYLISEFWSLAM